MSIKKNLPTNEEVVNYIDNEIKEGKIRIGLEIDMDTCGGLFYICKRLITGYAIVKDKNNEIRSYPIFLNSIYTKNGDDHSFEGLKLDQDDVLISVIPASPCYEVHGFIPDNNSSSFDEIKSCDMVILKDVILGYELPNQEHPTNWIGEYRTEFLFSIKTKENKKFIEWLESFKEINSEIRSENKI